MSCLPTPRTRFGYFYGSPVPLLIILLALLLTFAANLIA